LQGRHSAALTIITGIWEAESGVSLTRAGVAPQDAPQYWVHNAGPACLRTLVVSLLFEDEKQGVLVARDELLPALWSNLADRRSDEPGK
jgi:hypothetical protein